MANNISRKLSRSPKLPTSPHLESDTTPAAANAPSHSGMEIIHHNIPRLIRLGSYGYIGASSNQNSYNLSTVDNRIDNRVDNSLNYTTRYTIINHYNERSKEPLRKVYFMVPYSRNERFIGISQTLVWLEKKIKRGRANHHRMALWGMGGVGKTHDVLECIYHYQSHLSVFWVHAGSQLQFERDYRKLAKLAGLLLDDHVKQDIRPVVKSWLEGPESGNWILVLDNADDQLGFFKSAHADIDVTGDNGLQKFIPHGPKGIIIITTRDREVADRLVGRYNILDKTVMDSTHAKQLFAQNYPKASEYTGNEGNSITLLLKELQYLPLAIAQVAAYLRQNTLLLPSEYLNLFRTTKDGQKKLLSKPFSDIRRECQSETVLATFSISFRQLQEQSPLASSLLQLMACIDNQCIPHELLACGIGGDDQITQLQLGEALSKLIAFGLLSISRQGKDYEIHSLVHASINSFISVKEKDTAVKQLAGTFRRIYPEMQAKSYDTWILYLLHASALLNHMKESCKDNAYIYGVISSLLLLTGNTSAAKEKAKQAAKLGTDMCGPEHPDTLLAIGNLALAYQYQGHLKMAEELVVQVMEAQNRVLGPEHPDTSRTIDNLAVIYQNQGRLKEAEELVVRVIESQKRVLDSEHPDTLRTIGNLAVIYQNQGRLKEAEELVVQVMEAQKRVLGLEHPDTLGNIDNLAVIYQNQGRLKEAEELVVQVMEVRKRVLGREHQIALISIGNHQNSSKPELAVARLARAQRLEHPFRMSARIDRFQGTGSEIHDAAEARGKEGEHVEDGGASKKKGLRGDEKRRIKEERQETEEDEKPRPGAETSKVRKEEAESKQSLKTLELRGGGKPGVDAKEQTKYWGEERIRVAADKAREIVLAEGREILEKEHVHGELLQLGKEVEVGTAVIEPQLASDVSTPSYLRTMDPSLGKSSESVHLQLVGVNTSASQHLGSAPPLDPELTPSIMGDDGDHEPSTKLRPLPMPDIALELEEEKGVTGSGRNAKATPEMASPAASVVLGPPLNLGGYDNNSENPEQENETHFLTGGQQAGQQACSENCDTLVTRSEPANHALANASERFQHQTIAWLTTFLDRKEKIDICNISHEWSLLEKITDWIEKLHGRPVHWWRLRPRKQPLTHSKSFFRVQWTCCTCKKQLVASISDKHAEALKQWLEVDNSQRLPIVQAPTTTIPNHSTSNTQGRVDHQLATSTTQPPQPANGSNHKPNTRSSKSTTPSNNQTVSLQYGQSINLPSTIKHLLWCVKPFSRCTYVLHIEILPSDNDSTIFYKMSKNYFKVRGWRLWLSLYNISQIKFIKCKRYYKNQVACSNREELPPHTNPNYDYTPKKQNPDIPPIESEVLVHYLERPDCAASSGAIISALPKKLNGELDYLEEGWGLQVIEELYIYKIFLLSAVVLSISLISVPLWLWKHPGDIQGAFTIPKYLLGLFELVLVLPQLAGAQL